MSASSAGTVLARIGAVEIELNADHIYRAPGLAPTYDYVPWNVIGEMIARAELDDLCLVDVGANVGDSLAQFRRVATGAAVCIEPAPHFFAILERNVARFDRAVAVNKLAAPAALFDRVAFRVGGQTGASAATDDGDEAWRGPYVSFEEIFSHPARRFVVKSDTDGFDAALIRAAVRALPPGKSAPILFFEGPTGRQIAAGETEECLETISVLQRLDYEILLFTNLGMPYVFAGRSIEAVRSAFSALELGYQHGAAMFHYFDVLAAAPALADDFLRLGQPWPDRMFQRS